MELIEEMEDYAKTYNVPIMQPEGIAFLCAFIQQHHLTNILEIGSAIGYSAIRMALLDEQIHVVTIERDKERYQKAVENVRKAHLEERITLLYGDALETTVEGSFDMLFIDAVMSLLIILSSMGMSNIRNGLKIGICDSLSPKSVDLLSI